MEATFCLRAAAISLPSRSRPMLPSLHPAAALSSHLRRGVCRVAFSHALPPPAMEDSGGRKVVGAIGAAMVVACTVGVVYLSMSPRGALILTAGGGGGSAGRSSSSIAAANNGGGPVAPGEDDNKEVPIDDDSGPTTPLLLDKMLLGGLQAQGAEKKPAAEKPSVLLLLHLFSKVLDPSKQLDFVNLLHHLVFGHDPLSGYEELEEPGKPAPSESPHPKSKWLPPLEKMEAGLALAQVYFDLKEYEKARGVMIAITKSGQYVTKDPRIPFIEAITCMMLALQQMLEASESKDSDEIKKKVQSLVEEAKSKWEVYKDLGKEGFTLFGPPPLTSDDDSV